MGNAVQYLLSVAQQKYACCISDYRLIEEIASNWHLWYTCVKDMGVCACIIFGVCAFVFLTKLSVSATLQETELGVAACQLLLSYRDTQSYNNRSRAQRG